MGESVAEFLTRHGAEDLLHVDEADEAVLAHFGVKGMRWGVRREQRALNKLNRKQAKVDKKQAELDAKQAKLDSKGGKSGAVRISPKNDQGQQTEAYVSADAERFIKTQMKPGVSMSDREIKEAIQRANIAKQYNDMFAPDANKDLRNKVDAMELQARMSKAQAELNRKPDRLAQVSKLLDTSGKAFDAYKKLDKATDGKLNKKMAFQFSTKPDARLAREIAREGNKAVDLAAKSRLKSMARKRHIAETLVDSRSLLKETDALLKVGLDGTTQAALF